MEVRHSRQLKSQPLVSCDAKSERDCEADLPVGVDVEQARRAMPRHGRVEFAAVRAARSGGGHAQGLDGDEAEVERHQELMNAYVSRRVYGEFRSNELNVQFDGQDPGYQPPFDPARPWGGANRSAPAVFSQWAKGLRAWVLRSIARHLFGNQVSLSVTAAAAPSSAPVRSLGASLEPYASALDAVCAYIAAWRGAFIHAGNHAPGFVAFLADLPLEAARYDIVVFETALLILNAFVLLVSEV